MPNPEMVCIEWVDAIFSKDEPVPPITLYSLGFLCYNGEDYTTIAMETDGEKSRDYLTVPHEYIREITYLTPRGTE